jgi:pimeloyl-ACP methyl ester carboxylesterase
MAAASCPNIALRRNSWWADHANSALDAEAALASDRPAWHRATDVVLYGHSLGSAIAAELAARDTPRALAQSRSVRRGAMLRFRECRASRVVALISRIHFDTPARLAAPGPGLGFPRRP